MVTKFLVYVFPERNAIGLGFGQYLETTFAIQHFMPNIGQNLINIMLYSSNPCKDFHQIFRIYLSQEDLVLIRFRVSFGPKFSGYIYFFFHLYICGFSTVQNHIQIFTRKTKQNSLEPTSGENCCHGHYFNFRYLHCKLCAKQTASQFHRFIYLHFICFNATVVQNV